MKIVKNPIFISVAIGFVIGVLWLATIRFVTFKSDSTHYHANFVLYINGQKDEFKNFTFYEEVQSCGVHNSSNPKTRAHMHDFANNVVHVHEPGVMWGHFFSNLGYTLGDNLVKTDKGLFSDGQNDKITFILNGEKVNTIANHPIGSEDVLLINFGNDDDAKLNHRYAEIKKDAAEYNKKNDPSSCAGTKELTLTQRIKNAFGFSQKAH